MNYATKQLTEALQQVTQSERSSECYAKPNGKASDRIKLSNDVSRFLEDRQDFLAKAKTTNEGKY